MTKILGRSLRGGAMRLSAMALLGASLLCCGQTVEWSWTPPPGSNWSPLVGTFPVQCGMVPIQILSDPANIRGAGRGYTYLETMMRIRQTGPTQFRMVLWEGAAGHVRLSEDWGHPFTLTGTNFRQVFQRGEVAIVDRFLTWTTVSGESRFTGETLSLVWQIREVNTGTIPRYGQNTDIIFEFSCTGFPPGHP